MRSIRSRLAAGSIGVALFGTVGAVVAVAATSGGLGGGATRGYQYGMMGGSGYSHGMGGSGYAPGSSGDGLGMMGGPGRGPGMMGGGYGSTSGTGSTSLGRVSQRVTLWIKSDTEHGRRGPGGAWHDAFLPANFKVGAAKTVAVTVLNYDDMAHSFTSPMLGVNRTIPAGSAKHPSRTTFTFTAPSRAGRYLWWCALPCDPFSMTHIGYVRGFVRVAA